jgi:hypothetical protein
MQAGMRNARQQVFFRFLPERTGFEYALAGHAMLDPAPTSGVVRRNTGARRVCRGR